MNEKEVYVLISTHTCLVSALQDLAELEFPPGSWKQGKIRLIQTTLAEARLRIEGILEDGEHSSV